MALTPFALELLVPHIRGEVLAFGYPDLLMSPEQASKIIQRPLYKSTSNGPSHKRDFALAETVEVFEALSAKLICIDAMPSREVEIVVDLNRHLDIGVFDLVVDAGTIEHCANVGQALMNAANAVKDGGHVFHSPPLSMANHGFYNICPTLLMDFYEQNGWTVEHVSGFNVRAPYQAIQIDPRKRFIQQESCCLYFLAKRNNGALLKWPIQSKYLK